MPGCRRPRRACRSCRCAASSAPTSSRHRARLARDRQSVRPRGDDPILLVPAIRPDVALFHAARADRAGNVWIGVRRELMTMAHAARTTLVTVEEIIDADLLADDRQRRRHDPGALCHRGRAGARGAWPVGLRGAYPPDREHLSLYAELAASEAGFARYLDRFVLAAGRGRMSDWRREELLIDALAGMLEGLGHVAVGAASPIPGAAALLARARSGGSAAGLGARQRAPQPVHRRRPRAVRLRRAGPDRRFLPGRRPDRRRAPTSTSSASAAIRASQVRWPGSFGSAYLYFLVPRVILFREEHTRARAGAEGRLRQRARHEPAPRSIARAGRTRWSPGAACSASIAARAPLSAAERASRARPSSDIARPHRLRFRRCRARCPQTPAPTRRRRWR